MLYDSPMNEKLRTSPEFRAAEKKVRNLENEANKLAPLVDELNRRVGNLSQQIRFSGSDSPAGGRLAIELSQAQFDLKGATEALADIQAQLAEAVAERDSLLND